MTTWVSVHFKVLVVGFVPSSGKLESHYATALHSLQYRAESGRTRGGQAWLLLSIGCNFTVCLPQVWLGACPQVDTPCTQAGTSKMGRSFLGHGRGMPSEEILLEDLGFLQESSYKKEQTRLHLVLFIFWLRCDYMPCLNRHSCQGASTSPELSTCRCHACEHSKPGWTSFPLQVAYQIFRSVDKDDVVVHDTIPTPSSTCTPL